MVIKKFPIPESKRSYRDGLEDGIEKERERVLKLIYEYGIKHNSHPYFLDVLKLIDPEKDY